MCRSRNVNCRPPRRDDDPGAVTAIGLHKHGESLDLFLVVGYGARASLAGKAPGQYQAGGHKSNLRKSHVSTLHRLSNVIAMPITYSNADQTSTIFRFFTSHSSHVGISDLPPCG